MRISRSILFILLLIALSLNGVVYASVSSVGSGAFQDKKIITGQVVDENGLATPGVTIVIKGTYQGAITDVDGKFEIEISSEDAMLVFSYIGYNSQEFAVNNKTTINVQLLPDITSLEEIAVVGYGVQKKVNITGGVDVIDSEVIQSRPVPNLSQALQGTAPSLQISTDNVKGGEPGAGMSWSIRGGSTPYVLVDGVPTDASNINPEDIESVSVLKDAASAAIYGAKAANGVVLITTKRGKNNDKVTVSYSNNFAWSSPIRIPDWQNSIDFANKYNFALESSRQPIFYTSEMIQVLQDYQDGKIDYETTEHNGEWGNIINGNANNDWGNLFFKNNALRLKHDLSVKGGSEKVAYYFSAGIFDQEGQSNFGEDGYDRFNFNANVDAKVTDWLKLNFNTKYARSTTLTSNGVEGLDYQVNWHNMLRLTPTQPLYNPYGEITQWSHLLSIEKGGYRKLQNDDLWMTIGGEFEPVEDWKTTLNYSRNLNTDKDKAQQVTVKETMPDETQRVAFNPVSSFDRYFSSNDYEMLNVTTGYAHALNAHNFGVLAGYEQTSEMYENLAATGLGQLSDATPNIGTSQGDPYNPEIPKVNALDHWSHLSSVGFFGRFNYNFNEKYLIEFNARYDGSSKFMNANTKWGFFPSLSAGYVLSKEDYWEPLANAVNLFKIRASYGSLGDHQSIENYQYIAMMDEIRQAAAADINISPEFYVMNGEPLWMAKTPRIPSPTLTWETVTTTNFGIDAHFLNSKLQTSFDYFIIETSDIAMPSETQLPSVFGAEPEEVNMGKLKNQGFELYLTWKDQVGNVNYSFTGVLGDNRKTVTHWPTEVNNLDGSYYTGMELGEIWGYETEGFFTDDEDVASHADQSQVDGYGFWQAGDIKYRDLDGNDTINTGLGNSDNHGDLTSLGNTTSRYNYGITVAADYKGLDFSMFWQGVAKKDWAFRPKANRFYGYSRNMDQNSHFVEQLDYWTPDNTDAYYPRPYVDEEAQKNTQVQSKYVVNAAYLRLKNIQLGYTFPKKWMNRVKIEKFRIYISGENLLTFSELPKSIDPELLQGYLNDAKVYPLQRSISFGMNIVL